MRVSRPAAKLFRKSHTQLEFQHMCTIWQDKDNYKRVIQKQEQHTMVTPRYVSNTQLRALLSKSKNRTPEEAGVDKGKQEKNVVIIDVRDSDRADGWIPGSHNVPSATFYEQIPYLMRQYSDEPVMLVFHCMFSQSRGPNCARLFCRFLNEKEARCRMDAEERKKGSDKADTITDSGECRAEITENMWCPACEVAILDGGFANWERDQSDLVVYEGHGRTEGPKNFYVFKEE